MCKQGLGGRSHLTRLYVCKLAHQFNAPHAQVEHAGHMSESRLLNLPDSCLDIIVLHSRAHCLLSASKATRQLVLQHADRLACNIHSTKTLQQRSKARARSAEAEFSSVVRRAKSVHLKLRTNAKGDDSQIGRIMSKSLHKGRPWQAVISLAIRVSPMLLQKCVLHTTPCSMMSHTVPFVLGVSFVLGVACRA